MLRLFESVCACGVVNNGRDRKVVKDVVNGKVVIVEELSSDHGSRWTLAKEVANCLFFIFAFRANAGVVPLNGVKVFIEYTVSGDKVNSCPVSGSVVYKGSIKLLYDLLSVVAKSHFCMSLCISLPEFIIDGFDFVVDLGFDVRLGYGASNEVGTGCA